MTMHPNILPLSGAVTAEAEDTTTLKARALAIHEATHGVLFEALGIPVERAAVGRAGGGFVSCERADVAPDVRAPEAVIAEWPATWTAPPDLPREWSLSAYCIAALGGGVGWQRVTGECDAARYAVSRYDLFIVENLLGRALGVPPYSEPVVRLIDIFTTAAARHVTNNWQWIEAVAAVLHESGTVSGADVRRLRPPPLKGSNP